ncbi:glycosylase [Terrimonas sp. NA20]|uniref:Glycosylase n=1 Tax=Terrimonas ginsenosidimutans TaxID=2908004 RepID=A0ABS9KR50_9BACT|nr:glycosylase [Terrimonas ginsenosidimutans]MCG2614794.1 glycosylase [Terrimonas ginsenosidimutans]
MMNKRLVISFLFGTILSVASYAQSRTVSQETMQQIYEEVKTPYKYGLVVVPQDNNKKIDCPTVFRKGKDWFMSWIVFDGRGYETWLAKSKDLLHWENLGRIMSFSDTAHWDNNQKAGYMALQDTKWGGNYQLNKFQGKYWMSYFGGKDRGYEAGELAIGMAFTGKNPAAAHEWQRIDHPVLTSTDPSVRWWENKKIFKSTVIEDKKKLTGYPFVMYYNANGDSSGNKPKWRWFERIGMAVSNDMVNWKRLGEDPVMHHPIGITGDAVLQKKGDLWIMFYFGAFWEGRKDAFNRFACSYDLVNWTDWNGDDLIRSSEPYDEKFAHKSFVVKHKGVVYHFYCAVNNKDQRGIAVATSVDKGKSSVNFVAQ